MEYMKVWTSFLDIVEPLSDDELGRLFRMMMIYTSTGEEPPKFAGNERYLWPVAKQQIDLAASKVEKLRENGLKGGRPANKDNQLKPNESKEKQTEANERLNVNVNVNDKDNNNHHHNNIMPIKRFIPPTVDEIKAYCEERGTYWIEPQQFIDYYESRGWIMTNGKKMVDWKAAVRTWEKNERDRQRERTADDIPY